jgi:thiamine-monophosphate kinase
LRAIGGEFALIDRIRQRVGASGGAVLLGIGDDAALLGPSGTASNLVVTTDLLIEDVHFRRSWCEPYLLGRKAAAVNLSDIAAMGGIPTATFLSIALPTNLTVEFVDDLIQGLDDCCKEFGSQIAGGDTNAAPDRLVISVTQIGTVFPTKAKRRTGARYGDRILVTGRLGDASAGLALLEKFGLAGAEKIAATAVRRQLSPTPRVAEGRIAGELGAVRAMMDLSDGLLGDLGKLCSASRTGAVVQMEAVPVGQGAKKTAAKLGANPLSYALYGGEDYELLIIVMAEAAQDVMVEIEKSTGTAVTDIGEIVAGDTVWYVDAAGQRFAASAGWDHFAGGEPASTGTTGRAEDDTIE